MYKKIFEGKKGIFFDLDGTIVNTTGLWASSVKEVLKNLGLDWVSEQNVFVPGVSLTVQWKELIHRYRIKTDKNIPELIDMTHEHYLKILNENKIEAKEGFWDFLYEIKEVKKLKAILTTNSIKKIGLETLKAIDAENSFDYIIFGDEIKNPKPDPEIYITALKNTGLSKESVLVFEDSVAGVLAAGKADIETIIIMDGFFPEGEYRGNILIALPNFRPLYNNLDKTMEDWFNYHIDIAEKREQERKNARASDVKN